MDIVALGEGKAGEEGKGIEETARRDKDHWFGVDGYILDESEDKRRTERTKFVTWVRKRVLGGVGGRDEF